MNISPSAVTRRGILAAPAGLAAVSIAPAASSAERPALDQWYRKPEPSRNEALPIGKGQIEAKNVATARGPTGPTPPIFKGRAR